MRLFTQLDDIWGWAKSLQVLAMGSEPSLQRRLDLALGFEFPESTRDGDFVPPKINLRSTRITSDFIDLYWFLATSSHIQVQNRENSLCSKQKSQAHPLRSLSSLSSPHDPGLFGSAVLSAVLSRGTPLTQRRAAPNRDVAMLSSKQIGGSDLTEAVKPGEVWDLWWSLDRRNWSGWWWLEPWNFMTFHFIYGNHTPFHIWFIIHNWCSYQYWIALFRYLIGALEHGFYDFPYPYAPWCWNIYQHLRHKWASFVGKYTIHGASGIYLEFHHPNWLSLHQFSEGLVNHQPVLFGKLLNGKLLNGKLLGIWSSEISNGWFGSDDLGLFHVVRAFASVNKMS